jgi:hypothetical protein
VRSRSARSQDVVRVDKLAEPQGKTAAPDTSAESVAETLELNDSIVKILSPHGRQLRPVSAGRCAFVGQFVERFLDATERDADLLGCTDEGDTAEYLSVEAPLVPVGPPPTLNQVFGFVEVQRRNAHTAARCDLANGEFVSLWGIRGWHLTST